MEVDRRRSGQPTELADLLEQLPARVLLDRMPGPVVGIGHDGIVAYANPAVVSLFGYVDGTMLGRTIQSLLVGHADDSAQHSVAVLRAADAGDIIEWHHAQGFALQTAVSTPLLLRATDPFLMIHVTDLTELRWSSRPT